jgi:glucose-1-phosphate adenylyltransferase
MARTRTLALILAGGKGGRLDLLTQDRAKPAVSFAGTHRLIDFPLSNCQNSGLEDVWISVQFNPVSLSDHLANGRPWDLDRTNGGLLLLHPRQGHDDRGGFMSGTADGLWRFAPLIREFAPEALVVLSADAVYRCDYDALVDEHRESGADLTVVTTEVDPEDAGRYGVVQAEGGRVREYAYKPEEPKGSLVANEVFVFSPERALDLLDELAETAGEDGLEDLGDGLLPTLVEQGKVSEHRFNGFWRDVGTVDAYHAVHQELLEHPAPIDLDDPGWPIFTKEAARRAPAHILEGASAEGSLIGPAALIAGHVERSIIGRGVIVEAGAVVCDSVVLPGAVVRADARVDRAVLDERTEVAKGARVGEADGEVALVGLEATVGEGDDVPAGGRFPDVEEFDGSRSRSL